MRAHAFASSGLVYLRGKHSINIPGHIHTGVMGACVLRHGIQNSMEAILARHPA